MNEYKMSSLSICIHNKSRYRCRECGGSDICIHNKRKQNCIDCGGSSLCEHKHIKYNCKRLFIYDENHI
jgi:hypothetical protein